MKDSEKSERYELCLHQIRSITEGEHNIIANLSNITSILKTNLNYYWIGFYMVDAERDELVLGPFQGTPACVRIARGKGVCGTCWETGVSQVVEDVHEFEGHIACDPHSKSEIVVPVRAADNSIAMVLDIDHDQINSFDHIDQQGLEAIAEYITTLI